MAYIVTNAQLTNIANAIRAKNESDDTYTITQIPNAIRTLGESTGSGAVTRTATDASYIVSNTKLTNIADAIREKSGKSGSLTLENMVTEIEDISINRLLYNWDFTQSLTDTIQGQTATLHTGEAWEISGKSAGTTVPTRNNTGVVFSDAQQLVRLLPISMEMNEFIRNKTIQVDITSFQPASDVNETNCQEMRVLMTATSDTKTMDCGLIYSFSTAIYDPKTGERQYDTELDHPGFGIQARIYMEAGSAQDGWQIQRAPMCNNNLTDISGKTIGIYVDNNNYWHFYINSNFIGTGQNPIIHDTLGLQIGAGGRPFWGGCFYNATVSGARIYSGNIYS